MPPLPLLSSPPFSPPPPTPQIYELTPPPPSPIAAASPPPTEITEAKPNSRQMQEQTNITSTENGDASPITKPEPARVPSNNHNSDSIKDKPARDNSDDIGIIDSNRNNYNHPGKPSDFGTNDNGKFVYDLGGNHIDTKDDPTRVDNNDSPASSISNEPRTTDAYCSDDRDCNKATFSPFNANTVPPIEFAQATPVPDVRSLRSTDNASAILPGDATQCHRSPQQLQHPLDSDHTQANASDIASTPPSLYFDDNDIYTDTARSLSSNADSTASHSDSDTAASVTITACTLSTSRSDLGTDSSPHFSDATDSNSKKDTADNVASFVNIPDSTITSKRPGTFDTTDTDTSNSNNSFNNNVNIPCTIHTVTASHNDSDNTTSLITTACAFSASDLDLRASTFSDNNKSNSDNATGIVDTACTLSADPADNNTNRKRPDIPNSSSTDLASSIHNGTTTTTHDNEPKHECVRLPPLVVNPQAPPFTALPPAKPAEPPPALPTNTAPSLPTRKLCKTLSSISFTTLPTCATTRPLVSAAQHPVSHRQRTILATENTIDGLTQEGQFLKHPGGVTTGYMLGLQMPESGCLRLTQSDQRHRTARGVAPSPHLLPCPHLVTLFSVVMDS